MPGTDFKSDEECGDAVLAGSIPVRFRHVTPNVTRDTNCAIQRADLPPNDRAPAQRSDRRSAMRFVRSISLLVASAGVGGLLACGPVHSVTIGRGGPPPSGPPVVVREGGANGPPPWAPAHGYRRNGTHKHHGHGHGDDDD